jgi:PKD repeat protein
MLKFEVNEIEFDYLNRELSSYYCGEVIRVIHKVNPLITIDKVYKIAGIKHNITENSWYTTYSLKPSDGQRVYDHQQENNYPDATISMNALTGDTNYNFTATLTNFPTGMIDSVHWYIDNDGFYYEDGQIYDFSQNGEVFKNDTPRTGNSLTFNFDDDGILDMFIYGPGDKFVAAVVTDKNGYTFIVKKRITVTAAQAYANFNYTRDTYDGYTFFDASGTDTDTWLWNFGDGTTSTLQNPPTKYYNAAGTYNVSLTADNGITTNTKTIQITVTSTLIPVKYLKYEFKGIRTRANNTSPWNKNFIRYISLIEGRDGAGSSITYNCPTAIVVNKGTAVINGTNVTAPTPNSYPTDSVWSGIGYSTLSTDIKLNPLVTNNGNTEEYDISLIVDMSNKISQSTTNGLVTSTIHNSAWDGINNNERFKLNDSWFIPHGWELNIHYEPINVYVSADGINYYKIGDQNVYRTSYPPSTQTVVWSLDNKVVMPPRFPT